GFKKFQEATFACLTSFWAAHRTKFPLLSKAAEWVFSLPVFSVAVERGFSIQTHVIRRLRGSPVLISTVVNEIFLQVYGAQYLHNMVNEAPCTVDDYTRTPAALVDESMHIPAPPSPRQAAHDALNDSLLSEIELESDDDDDRPTSPALLVTQELDCFA
ncbi:MAG: hAT transposon family protein, partial [Cytophagaceae bacterium]